MKNKKKGRERRIKRNEIGEECDPFLKNGGKTFFGGFFSQNQPPRAPPLV